MFFKEYSSDKILENISGKQSAFNAQSQREVGSYFTLGEFDGSISGLLNMAPKAVIATFFRPFIWESRNLVMILSSLEAMALFIFTVYVLIKGKFVHFFTIMFKNSTVFYCLAFSFFFAIFVGISTYNFGSLVRYKIPCIPYFVCSLFIINYLRQQRVKNN